MKKFSKEIGFSEMILYSFFFPEDQHAPIKSPMQGFQIGSLSPFQIRF